MVGCGGKVKQEGQALRAQSLLASSPPLARAIVTDQEIAKYPPSSVQYAFFNFWQALQFHAWRNGLSWYDTALQRFIGPQQIIDGLETLASYYRAVKPVVYSVKSTSYGTTQVRYLGVPPAGLTGLETVEWRRVRNTWRIEFDSFLSRGLVSYSEEAEQEQIDPSAQTPSRHAIRVGEAAGHLQARYLATLVDRAYQAHSGSHRSH
jgi:hypothetical protein